MDIKDIRHKKLELLKLNYKNQREFADALQKDATYINQLLSGHRGIGEKVAREFEKTIGLPHLWFDEETTYKNKELNHPFVNEINEVKGRYVYTKQHIDLLTAFDQLTDPQKNLFLSEAIKLAQENIENFKHLKQVFEGKDK